MGHKAHAGKIAGNRPPFPFQVEYLWNWFNELSLGLTSSGMGPVTASWSDVATWAVLTDVQPEPWEVKALVRLSNARARVLSEKASDGHSRPA